jgi:hypothetical protein
MEVMGDGTSTLLQLIQQHQKARYREEEMRIKHADDLEAIVPINQRHYLTHAANLNRGANFINLEHLIDEELLEIFDRFSHHAQFYYGRYDIKCASVDELKKGNFTILEFNGSGAEPNHVYNSGYTLVQAQKEFLDHWKVLYRISKYNHQQGVTYWPFMKGWKFLKEARKHLRILEEYDTKILF